MRRIMLFAVLVLAVFSAGGCATLIGGIIGHQSGEAVAGAIIGAGIDFGGGIIDGIGGLLTPAQKRFEQKSSLDSATGRITLARGEYPVDKVEKMTAALAVKLEENGWSRTMMEKKIQTGNTLFFEKWQCNNADAQEFTLSVLRERHKDTQVTIETSEESTVNKDAVSVDVYAWLKDSI